LESKVYSSHNKTPYDFPRILFFNSTTNFRTRIRRIPLGFWWQLVPNYALHLGRGSIAVLTGIASQLANWPCLVLPKLLWKYLIIGANEPFSEKDLPNCGLSIFEAGLTTSIG
jgi:hypothetical protein